MSLFGKRDPAVATSNNVPIIRDATYDSRMMAYKLVCPLCQTNHMIADDALAQSLTPYVYCPSNCGNSWSANAGWRYQTSTSPASFSPSGYSQQQMAQAWPSSYGYAQALAYSQSLSSLPYNSPYPAAQAITTTMPDGLKDYPERTDILIGYRAYQLKWDGMDICLKGARADWSEREYTAKCTSDWSEREYTAKCTSLSETASGVTPEELCRIHLADPNAQCSDDHHGCGIYAMRKAQGIDYVNLESYRIVAETALFGWVATYTLGYRAEKARIEKLTYLHDGVVLAPDQAIADALMARYGVPVEFQAITAWKAA
jgi:hypothetical protein